MAISLDMFADVDAVQIEKSIEVRMKKFTVLTIAAAMFGATGAVAQDYTKSGSQLSLGEPAVVPHLVPKGPEVPIEVKITSVEEGSKSDLAGFNVPDSLRNHRPVYVRYEYTNLSDEDLSNQSIGAFIALDDRNERHMPQRAIGDCRTPTARALTKGKSHEGCLVFLIHENGKLQAAAYRGRYRHETGQDTKALYPTYYDPILWKPEGAAAGTDKAQSQDRENTTARQAATQPNYAKPGLELSLRESAVVPYLVPKGPEVPIELTITSVEEGSKGDLAKFKVPDSLRDHRPVYVRYEYTNLSDEDLSNQSIGAFIALDDRNERHMPQLPVGDCRTPAARALTKGKTHGGCLVFLIHENGKLQATAYRGHYRHETGQDTRALYPIYYNPVRWLTGSVEPR